MQRVSCITGHIHRIRPIAAHTEPRTATIQHLQHLENSHHHENKHRRCDRLTRVATQDLQNGQHQKNEHRYCDRLNRATTQDLQHLENKQRHVSDHKHHDRLTTAAILHLINTLHEEQTASRELPTRVIRIPVQHMQKVEKQKTQSWGE